MILKILFIFIGGTLFGMALLFTVLELNRTEVEDKGDTHVNQSMESVRQDQLVEPLVNSDSVTTLAESGELGSQASEIQRVRELDQSEIQPDVKVEPEGLPGHEQEKSGKAFMAEWTDRDHQKYWQHLSTVYGLPERVFSRSQMMYAFIEMDVDRLQRVGQEILRDAPSVDAFSDTLDRLESQPKESNALQIERAKERFAYSLIEDLIDSKTLVLEE